jgi:hypothetical protein
MALKKLKKLNEVAGYAAMQAAKAEWQAAVTANGGMSPEALAKRKLYRAAIDVCGQQAGWALS